MNDMTNREIIHRMQETVLQRLPRAFALAALGTLVGCAASAPPRTDPFSGLNLKNPAYRELSMVLVLSENTKNALGHSDRVGKQMEGSLFGYALDFESFFADVASTLQKNFKSVVKAERLADAGALRPDIVAVLDIYIETPKSIYSDAKFDVSAILMTPDNVPIDTLTGQSVQSPRSFPGFVGEKRVKAAISAASEEARGRLEGALLASANLNEFAKGRTAVPGSAPKPAAPAAKPPILSDVDELPNVPAFAKRKGHAVVIGVRGYRQSLPDADFADSDARLVSRYLTQVLGYPEENVATLINEHAAKSDFEKYLERWLPNRVEKDDEVLIYYSGHGAPNAATGDAYLVPYDGDPTYLAETAYPLARMYAQLAKLPTRKVTVVMDSCFSGAGGRSVIAKGARPLVTVVEKEAAPPNVEILTASAGDQISHGYAEKGHGLFTYFLLKGISQQAVKGRVSLKSAFDFATPQVSRVARRDYNSDQVPQRRGESP